MLLQYQSEKGSPMEQHRDRVTVNLRFDEGLHQRLVAEAKRSLRSLNNEVMFRLRESIERDSEAAAGVS
jgi:predicted HicB family RNase H-like nuclease